LAAPCKCNFFELIAHCSLLIAEFMDALILTPAQSAALIAANPLKSSRRLEPRALEDGTFLLNADVLDDPTFADATKPWRAILDEVPLPKPTDQTLEQLDAIDLAAKAAKEVEAIQG
jgi:hypothetical protein